MQAKMRRRFNAAVIILCAIAFGAVAMVNIGFWYVSVPEEADPVFLSSTKVGPLLTIEVAGDNTVIHAQGFMFVLQGAISAPRGANVSLLKDTEGGFWVVWPGASEPRKVAL